MITGPSNLKFGICGKAWRVGLDLRPRDLGLDCSKPRETRRQENSSRRRWRNPVASMLIWPSDRVEIIVNPVMMCPLCWPSDMG